MQATERGRALSKGWLTLFLLLTVTGILLAVHQLFGLYELTGMMLMENSYLYLLLGIFLSLVFIVFPATKGAPRDRVPWYDVILSLLTLGVSSYFAWHGLIIAQQAWALIAPLAPTVVGSLLWLLVLEGARRTAGKALFFMVIIISFYPLYAGYMPRIISGFSLSFLETGRYHSMSVESIIGIPMRVVGTLFIGFLLMGSALLVTGGGQFFVNLSSAILGHFRGGPAKVAIFASGLFGTMSGSVVSNVLATGSFTIPAMKRIGYPPRFAAAIEACASTGGVLMPPVMGAAAFLMASLLRISYWQVAVAAAIPSILYYFGLFVQIDAYAARIGLKGLPKEELPSLWGTLKGGWFYILVLVMLVWFLAYLRQEALAPFYATALLLLLANVRKETRMNFSKFLDFTASTGRLLVEIIGILAAVGLIIGSLSVTGMAITFSGDLTRILGGSVPALLVMGAITSLILGMGMTVTACYIFLAVVLAPALVAAGLNPLAVHLFLMYWGMISFITPPVALGAYAAASLAQAEPMRTGFEAMRLGAIIYFLPFFFVLEPVLVLQGYLVGVGRLGAGGLGWLTRIPLIAGGVLVGWPGMWLTVVGGLLCAPVILGYLVSNRRARHSR